MADLFAVIEAGKVRQLVPPDDHLGKMERQRYIASWLFIVVAMIFVMIVLGGLTRLTHSGLSMVEWRPISGWLPPLDEETWWQIFALYRASPEYQQFNQGMTLPEFKSIFWLEFIHRLWGRLIGIVFIVPFLVFSFKRWIAKPLAIKFIIMFVLGGLQGVLGWFMVKSGLTDRADVSQYRLAAHLGLGLALFGLVLWVALDCLRGRVRAESYRLSQAAFVLVGLIFTTALSGALVAGLDAGLIYNTFPMMGENWIPDGAFDLSPAYLNFFENVAMVQFDHRLLAMTVVICVIVFWVWIRERNITPGAKRSATYLMAMGVIQVVLGVSTLLLVVPVPLAALHQAGAVVLLGFSIWTAHELSFAM